MWNNGHDAYLESRVMTADPVELINLLYQACTQSVRDARTHLAAGQIAERAREITRASAIVSELTVVLDHERGGEISQRLALLYDYIQRRLITANLDQSDEPLAEVLGLLVTLSEGWAGVRPPEIIAAPEPPVPVDSAWSQPLTQESSYGSAYGMQSWSL